MLTIDYIMVSVIFFSFIFGLFRGFCKEILSFFFGFLIFIFLIIIIIFFRSMKRLCNIFFLKNNFLFS